MKLKYFLLVTIIGVLPQLLQGQVLNRTSIKFKDKTDKVLRHPQVGGLNSPQFAGIDMNNDGQEDLVVFDRKLPCQNTELIFCPLLKIAVKMLELFFRRYLSSDL